MQSSEQTIREVYDTLEKITSWHNQMYKLSKEKRTSRVFILQNLNRAFCEAASGYDLANVKHNSRKMDTFKEECRKFSTCGFKIAAKSVCGNDSDTTREWKKRNEDFDSWYKNWNDLVGTPPPPQASSDQCHSVRKKKLNKR